MSLCQKENNQNLEKQLIFGHMEMHGLQQKESKPFQKLEELIFEFLGNTDANIKKAFLLIDSKVGVTELDKDVIDFLREQNYPTVVVAGKTDKINNSKRAILQKNIKITFPESKIIHFSAIKKIGKTEILKEFSLD